MTPMAVARVWRACYSRGDRQCDSGHFSTGKPHFVALAQSVCKATQRLKRVGPVPTNVVAESGLRGNHGAGGKVCSTVSVSGRQFVRVVVVVPVFAKL